MDHPHIVTSPGQGNGGDVHDVAAISHKLPAYIYPHTADVSKVHGTLTGQVNVGTPDKAASSRMKPTKDHATLTEPQLTAFEGLRKHAARKFFFLLGLPLMLSVVMNTSSVDGKLPGSKDDFKVKYGHTRPARPAMRGKSKEAPFR
jgi:hypothetical protein